MTKDKAIYSWFVNFGEEHGLTVFPNTAVPDEIRLPYLTYQYSDSAFRDEVVPITVNIWKRTTSEAEMNALVRDFRDYLENNSKIRCDEGLIFVFAGSPFANGSDKQDERYLKLRSINITLDYLTEL